MGNLPQVEAKIEKNVWNHQLAIVYPLPKKNLERFIGKDRSPRIAPSKHPAGSAFKPLSEFTVLCYKKNPTVTVEPELNTVEPMEPAHTAKVGS